MALGGLHEFFRSFACQERRHHLISAGTNLLGKLPSTRMSGNQEGDSDLKCGDLSFKFFKFSHRSLLSWHRLT
ncbi:hypothetical protein C6V07_01540 [Burkholderia gladioli]|nr:hypothetical protein C6V07_01540 [Burkholderia gladioli]